MPRDNPAAEVTIWTEAPRAGTVRQILAEMGPLVRAIGVGGSRSAELDGLARGLNCPLEDDFRKLMIDRPAEFVLLGGTTDLGPADLLTVLDQGSTVICLEPPAGTFQELDELYAPARRRSPAEEPTARAGRLIVAPSMTRSPSWLSAADPAAAIELAESLSLVTVGHPADCSLFARLYDAWQTALSLMLMPDTIDATMVTPLAEAPESLRLITGHITAHGRLSDGRGLTLQASDQAGSTFRRIDLLGKTGSFHATDDMYVLMNRRGEIIDQWRAEGYVLNFTALVAATWRPLLGRTSGGGGGGTEAVNVDHERRVLACCLASLLSSRTGQPENPAKLLSLKVAG